MFDDIEWVDVDVFDVLLCCFDVILLYVKCLMYVLVDVCVFDFDVLKLVGFMIFVIVVLLQFVVFVVYQLCVVVVVWVFQVCVVEVV